MNKHIIKSMKETRIVADGRIILGKYTLFTKSILPIKLLDASLSPVEKSNHGSIPAKTIIE